MLRFVGLGLLMGILTTTAMAGDCTGGGRELGAPVPNLKTPGYFEPGKPEAITIKDAKVYRSIHSEDKQPKFKEFVAVHGDRLVALVQEFPPDDKSRILEALQTEYGSGQSEAPDSLPESTDPSIGFAAEVIAQHSWEVPECGFAIRYVEAISPTAVFGVTAAYKLRAIVWTKRNKVPVVTGSVGAVP